MKIAWGIIAFFWLALSPIRFDLSNTGDLAPKIFDQRPEFFVLDWKPGTILREKNTAISIVIYDSSRTPVTALVNKNGEPVMYTADLATPVCADGECKLMHIRMYWTLLGGYAGFDRYPSLPLTKHDHDDFLEEDYMKLHQLLMDNNSVLGRRKIDQLVIKPEKPKVEGVDGASGATIAAVKKSVVAGALYSCYVAWHLAHGEIKDQLKKHTFAALTNDMVIAMLNSSHRDYQMYALKSIDDQQYQQHHTRIAEIFKSGIPLIRTFIIKNLPDTIWEDPGLQQPYWQSFSHIDINSRSLLLQHLNQAPKVSVKDLSLHLEVMTKNQIKVYLQHVTESDPADQTILDNLTAFAGSKTQSYSYLVEQYLEDLEE
ncbi:MAG: hypothetical protein ACR2MX_18615 [Cyclobacteriaceae bacterium]